MNMLSEKLEQGVSHEQMLPKGMWPPVENCEERWGRTNNTVRVQVITDCTSANHDDDDDDDDDNLWDYISN